METIQSVQEFDQILAENDAVLAYFSTEICSVCKVLKQKVIEMVSNSFPKMRTLFIESDKLPEIAAQNLVFTAPTIIIFFAGRETIRKSRTFGITELESEISRPYFLIFD